MCSRLSSLRSSNSGRVGIGVVSSVAGYGGLPTALVYGATKAALIDLAETLYLDLTPRGIDVYVVNPGFVKTPLTDRTPCDAGADQREAGGRSTRAGCARCFRDRLPLRFTLSIKLLRLLPYWLYFRVVQRFTGL